MALTRTHSVLSYLSIKLFCASAEAFSANKCKVSIGYKILFCTARLDINKDNTSLTLIFFDTSISLVSLLTLITNLASTILNRHPSSKPLIHFTVTFFKSNLEDIAGGFTGGN